MEFQEYEDLLQHFNTHLGAMRIKCDLCPKWFLFPYQLKNHVREEHQSNHPIVCPDCGKMSKSGQNFISHYHAAHSKEGEIINCQLCNKTFTKMVSFISHLRHKNRKFRCEKCGMDLQTAQSLRNHLFTHAERTYHCDFCEKSFKQSKYLKNHKWWMHSIIEQTW